MSWRYQADYLSHILRYSTTKPTAAVPHVFYVQFVKAQPSHNTLRVPSPAYKKHLGCFQASEAPGTYKINSNRKVPLAVWTQSSLQGTGTCRRRSQKRDVL